MTAVSRGCCDAHLLLGVEIAYERAQGGTRAEGAPSRLVRMMGEPATAESFFEGSPLGLELFRTIAQVLVSITGAEPECRVSKSQIAFRRRRGFAYVWRPGQYVRSDVPAVLSLALDRKLSSSRFKEIVHPSATVWMHHLELRDVTDVDDEVTGWLEEAYRAAE